jgi:hypothetical protein
MSPTGSVCGNGSRVNPKVQTTACWLLVVLVLGALVFHFRVHPLYKYRLGMTLSEARAVMSRQYPVEAIKIAYQEGGPDEDQKQRHVRYVIEVKNEGVTLEFNYYERLLRIETWWQHLVPRRVTIVTNPPPAYIIHKRE